MKYSNISYLMKSIDFLSFIKDFEFKHYYYDNKIYMFNGCLTIEIYAFEIEKIIYFDLYNHNLEYSSNIDGLLANRSRETKKQIIANKKIFYQNYGEVDESQIDKEYREIREMKFYLYMELLSKLFNNLLQCENINVIKEIFTPTFEVHKKRVQEVKDKFFNKRKTRFLIDDL